MSWNWRVAKKTYKDEVFYQIHEVYYDEQGEVKSWTKDPVYPYAESVEDLKWVLGEYQKALDKPVLELDDN